MIEETKDEFLGDGEFCCPICLHFYETREAKQDCISSHGYETINLEVATVH